MAKTIRQQLEESLATLKRTVDENRQMLEAQIEYRVIVDGQQTDVGHDYDNLLIWLGRHHRNIKSIGTWAVPKIISADSDIHVIVLLRETKEVLTLPDLFKLCKSE